MHPTRRKVPRLICGAREYSNALTPPSQAAADVLCDAFFSFEQHCAGDRHSPTGDVEMMLVVIS